MNEKNHGCHRCDKTLGSEEGPICAACAVTESGRFLEWEEIVELEYQLFPELLAEFEDAKAHGVDDATALFDVTFPLYLATAHEELRELMALMEEMVADQANGFRHQTQREAGLQTLMVVMFHRLSLAKDAEALGFAGMLMLIRSGLIAEQTTGVNPRMHVEALVQRAIERIVRD